MELEIKDTAICISIQKCEILRYNSNKYIQDLYKENYKILINEIKEQLNKAERYSMFGSRKTQYC